MYLESMSRTFSSRGTLLRPFGQLRAIHFCLFIFALTLVCAPDGNAQTSTGSIRGAIRDSSGAVVPDVAVTLTQVTTNVARSTVTNVDGRYVFPFLPPSTYRVEARKQGFGSFVRDNLVIDVNLAATVDINLQVGAAAQTVTVTAETPLLETSTSSLGEVVTSTQINELPTNGRNPFAFTALVAGVQAPYGFSQTAYDMYTDQFVSINGSRPNQNIFIIDGGNSTEPMFNGPAIYPSMDDVQEYKIQTSNFSAEFSNSAGGVVNITTKSGGDQYHGSAYEFIRNDAVDANNFFANGGKTPYKFNQFGVSFGGRIPKMKETFFFASYEGLRWVQTAVVLGTVPTLAQRQGDFSQTLDANGNVISIYNPFSASYGANRTAFQGNKIPQSMWDPVAKNILKWIPMPNVTNSVNGVNNFFSETGSSIYKDTASIRIDHSFTTSQKLNVLFMMNNAPIAYPSIFPAAIAASAPAIGHDQSNQQYALAHYTYALSNSTVMELASSYARYFLQRTIPSNGFDLTTLGWPASFNQVGTNTCFPMLFMTGMGFSGNSAATLAGTFTGYCYGIDDGTENISNVANFTHIQGHHTLKFGANFGWKYQNGQSGTNAASYYDFDPLFTEGPNPYAGPSQSGSSGSAVASFLLGTGLWGQIQSAAPSQDLLNRNFGFYVQDDWSVTPKLTLNLGVRWDYESPWTERHNRLSDFNFSAPSPLKVPGYSLVGGIEYPGVGGLPRGQWNSDWKNVVPRIGFAYAVDKNTALRGGFGMFTAPVTGGGFNSNAVPSDGFSAVTSWIPTFDYATPVNLLSNPYPYGFVSATGSSLGMSTELGQGVTGMDRNRPTPYAEQWNVSVQRALPKSFVLHVAYAGSRGIHLFGSLLANQLPDQYLSMGKDLGTQVPNPFYGIITSGALASATVSKERLLLPYPQFGQVTNPNASFGLSKYNSLQVNLERRFSQGLLMQFAYTYSKTMDDLPATTTGYPGGQFAAGAIQNYDNIKSAWAPAVWDMPNNFAANFVYQLPFGANKRFLNTGGVLGKVVGGWQLTAITIIQNGTPLSFTTATNTLGNNGGAQTPSLTGANPRVHGSSYSKVNEWFNPAGFTTPAPYTYGNVSRTESWLRGPGEANLDAGLDKDTSLSDRFTLQLRFETFNTLNHPWFGLPNTSIGSAGAGVISSQQNSPRTLQLAAKLLF